jgi:hypothetical protein
VYREVLTISNLLRPLVDLSQIISHPWILAATMVSLL